MRPTCCLGLRLVNLPARGCEAASVCGRVRESHSRTGRSRSPNEGYTCENPGSFRACHLFGAFRAYRIVEMEAGKRSKSPSEAFSYRQRPSLYISRSLSPSPRQPETRLPQPRAAAPVSCSLGKNIPSSSKIPLASRRSDQPAQFKPCVGPMEALQYAGHYSTQGHYS